MPKKGIVKCRSCDLEFEGLLPDEMLATYYYLAGRRLDPSLEKFLVEHHLDTGIPTGSGEKMQGHKLFDVFLEEGGTGTIEASHHYVIYTPQGKERS